MNHLDTRILSCIFVTHLSAAIRRANIDKNDLKILVGLIDDALYTLVEILFDFIDWYNY